MNEFIKKINKIENNYATVKTLKSLNILDLDSLFYKSLYNKSILEYKKNVCNDSYNTVIRVFKSHIKSLEGIKKRLVAHNLHIELSNDEGLICCKLFQKNTLEDAIVAFTDNNLQRIKAEMYIFKNYPYSYIAPKIGYVFGGFDYRFKNDIIIYDKEQSLLQIDENNHFILRTIESGSTLLDIIAYLSALPNFIELKNAEFNRRLHAMYSYFNICDCLLIREGAYQKKEIDYSYGLLLPILKDKKGYNLVEIPPMENGEVLNLYHTSLKQFEPMPRCVMLYRVVECAFDKYKKLFEPEEFKPQEALNYFWEEANKAKIAPLFYKRYNAKACAVHNLIDKLKTESKKIINKWENSAFLKNKTVGETIYLTGRNFSAHGCNKDRNARYDYSKNYKHINDVNILLEILARFVVEWLNPSLKSIVVKNKHLYSD